MSASSQCVTCGTFTHDACRRGPEMRLMRDSGTVSTGPNLAKSTAGIAGSAPAAARDPGRASERRLDVLARDAPLLACALDQVQIEAELAREPAHRRAGEDAGKIRLCRSGRWPRRRGARATVCAARGRWRLAARRRRLRRARGRTAFPRARRSLTKRRRRQPRPRRCARSGRPSTPCRRPSPQLRRRRRRRARAHPSSPCRTRA